MATEGSGESRQGARSFSVLVLLAVLVLPLLMAVSPGASPLGGSLPSVRTLSASEASHSPAVIRPSTVSISSFTISPNPVVTGETTYLNITVTGSTPPYFVNYSSGMPSSCPQTATAILNSTYSVACTPTLAGTYNIVAFATDLSTYGTSTGQLVVNAAPTGPSVTSFLASPGQITLGASTYFNSTVTGGTPPYTYAYGGLPPGCSSSSTSSLFCTPTKTGNYSIGLTVTDSTGLYTTASTTLGVTNSPGPLISSFLASPSSFTVGRSTQLTVQATGGTVPYTYVYGTLPTGCSSSNASTLSCTPTAAGTFHVNVTVTDAKHLSSVATTTVTVNALPSVASFAPSPSTISVGGSTIFRVTTSGGTAPLSYAYSALPPGCATQNTSALSCSPTTQGTYTVSVSVTDADGYTSSPYSTTLTVNGPPTVSSFVATPATFPVESSTYLNVTVSGGAPPFSYTYLGLPSGCRTMSTASLPCTPVSPGIFHVSVVVVDASGRTINGSTLVTVTRVPAILSFTATPPTVAAHASTVLSVQASGGTPPYSYFYTGLPVGCTTANVSSLTCQPVSVGRFNVTVTVSDARGNSNTSLLQVVVSASAGLPLINAFSASPSTVSVGSSVTVSANVTGGKPPYTYAYSGLPPGCSSLDSAVLLCNPSAPGTYPLHLSVTDSAGVSASATTNLTVTGTVQSLAISLNANPKSVSIGASVALNATLSGGEGPFSFAWSVNGANVSGAPNGTSWRWTSTKDGSFTFRAWVRDAQGIVAGSPQVVVTVGSSGGGSGGGTSSSSASPYLWLILPAVLVIAIMLGYFLFRRMNSRRQPPPESEGPTSPPAGFYGAPIGEVAPAPVPEGAPPETQAPMAPEVPYEETTPPEGHYGPELATSCPQCQNPRDPGAPCAICGSP